MRGKIPDQWLLFLSEFIKEMMKTDSWNTHVTVLRVGSSVFFWNLAAQQEHARKLQPVRCPVRLHHSLFLLAGEVEPDSRDNEDLNVLVPVKLVQ